MVTHHASQDSLHPVTADEPRISKNEALEQPTAEENEHSTINKGGAPVMRSKEDDLSIWQTVRRYKLVSIMAMAAAFSAALDGYQINLNGGLVSNNGFIRQMAKPGTTVIEGQYVSAWSGLQSSGQAVGQVYVTESYGRKVAFYIIWVIFVVSIFIESFATRWDHWLVAKLFSGMGVGMLQSTLPVYLSEIAPTQLRGFFINAYSFWFVVGQIFASVALNRLHAIDPLDFRTPIYTQWAMVGATIIIFIIMPETPWWLVSKGKIDKASKMLRTYNGRVEGYDVSEQIEIMSATVVEERRIAERDSQEGMWAVFQGRNFIRFVIAGWPKMTQQFVGLAVFNSNATYFFQYAGNKDPFLVTVILSCVQLLSMIMTAMLTDQIGRRPLTIYPYAVTTVSVLCLGIIGCFDYTQKSTSSLLVFFACLATFSTTGASSIGYAYAAEIPQQRLRAQTAGLSLAASNLIALIFAGTGTVAVIIAWFILPEVTRRTPAEIDEMFEKKVNLRKFKHYVTDVQTNASEQHEMEAHTRTA
ncbi:hexose transporter [Aspergillus arachidicola]|uniref:Hexose transporter n=1 Tax=Aspergillus arachidicola TaxID=656916 RepID=A0A2G7G099_9EURO|nr:hexose transporter [Aspergillus arachidicola]